MSKKTIKAMITDVSKAFGIDIHPYGRGGAWYHAEETDEVWLLDRSDLEHAIDCIASDSDDAYSEWCAYSGTLAPSKVARKLIG